MNYEQSKNIVNITQSSFSVAPPIISLPVSWIIEAALLSFFFTLSHKIPLHDSHLNTWFLNAELQANLAQNKANKMVDEIQPYNLPL